MPITALAENTPDMDNHTNGKRNFKIAYTMSRFPKLTETFILYEILSTSFMNKWCSGAILSLLF